jgi:hypothetical protein
LTQTLDENGFGENQWQANTNHNKGGAAADDF